MPKHDDFKYAKMADGGDKWAVGERVNGTYYDRATKSETIGTGQWYDLEVIVSGNTVTLTVGSVQKASYMFASGVDGGQVGLLVRNAVDLRIAGPPHFDDVWAKEVVSKRKHYFSLSRTGGGKRVAQRKDSVVQYVAGDHLGTTSVVLDANGGKMTETRHYPYGVERWPNDGTMPTDYRFTGQRLDSYIKLTIMGARWYDAQLGRWISPDPIIPQSANPQSFNRFTYVYNNSLRYVDPSGYDPLDEAWVGEFKKQHDGHEPTDRDRFWRIYSVVYPGPVSGGWPWTSEDWEYVRHNHDAVLEDTTHRSSIDDFSAAIGRLSGWYIEGEEAEFVSAIAMLYAGWPYDPTGENVYDVSIPDFQPIDFCPGASACLLWYYVNHGMEGFSDRYHYKGWENTHHWAGHLLFGYHEGGIAWNLIVTVSRELLQHDEDMLADIHLGYAAAHQAKALRKGRKTIHSFHVYIYNYLKAR